MGGTGIADPADIKGQTELREGEAPYLIEIDDVVAYIKAYLIGRIRQYFIDRQLTYSPASALGTDAYAANGTGLDYEAHRYWDDSSTLVREIVGNGRKNTPISAADVVNSVQSIVRQLARFRVFNKSGKIRYRKKGVCSKGCCTRYSDPLLKDDPDIPATSNMFFFLPTVSAAYTSINKSVGAVQRKDAVVNTLDVFDPSVVNTQPRAGTQIDAIAFRRYIDELFANWNRFIEANAISYYSEKCYNTTCNLYVEHCYKSCDGRSRR